MKKRIWSLALLLALTLSLCAPALAATQTYVVSQLTPIKTLGDDNWRPLCYYQWEEETYEGAAVELLEGAMQKFTYRCDYVHAVDVSKDEQLEMLLSGEVDILFPWDMATIPLGVVSTGPMFYDTLVLVSRQENENMDRKMQWVRTARVGIVQQAASARRLTTRLECENVTVYETDAALYTALQSGQVDVMIQRKSSFEEEYYRMELFEYSILWEDIANEVKYGYLVADKPGLRSMAVYLALHTKREDRQELAEQYRVGSEALVSRYIGFVHDRWQIAALVTLLFWVLVVLVFYAGHLRRQRLRLRMQARTYEQAFLQAQIKPHFLYNALGSVMDMCYVDGEAAGDLLGSLTSYLRIIYNTDESQSAVSLERELQLTRSYVNIESARFGGKPQVEFQVEEELLQLAIPPLTIQPLVENAIRHGLGGGEGLVRVWAEETEDRLIVRVSDTGTGMTPEQLEGLWGRRRSQSAWKEKGSSGVGLRNIRTRLEKLGGQIDMESRQGEGTTVTVTLPKIQATEEESA